MYIHTYTSAGIMFVTTCIMAVRFIACPSRPAPPQRRGDLSHYANVFPKRFVDLICVGASGGGGRVCRFSFMNSLPSLSILLGCRDHFSNSRACMKALWKINKYCIGICSDQSHTWRKLLHRGLWTWQCLYGSCNWNLECETWWLWVWQSWPLQLWLLQRWQGQLWLHQINS